MKSQTIKADSIQKLEGKLNSELPENFSPTLAIIFASVCFEPEKINSVFSSKNIQVFGASSYGEIINNQIHKNSIVVLLLDIPKNYFSIYANKLTDNNAYPISYKAGEIGQSIFANPAYLVAYSSFTVDGVSIVEGINNSHNEKTPLFGGMASNNLSEHKTFVFTNNEIYTEGLIFLIFDNDKIELNGIASSGWEAVGVARKITKANENVVYEIDNRPALDLFEEYYDLKRTNTPIGLEIGTKYPLQVINKDKTTVLRTVLLANKEEKSLVFGGRIEEGAMVKFSIQPTFEIINKTISEIVNLYSTNKHADALIMFTCVGRQVAFGPIMEEEIEGVYDIWNSPMAGLFTYGEIGNAPNKSSDFHNETCSLVLLREK